MKRKIILSITLSSSVLFADNVEFLIQVSEKLVSEVKTLKSEVKNLKTREQRTNLPDDTQRIEELERRIIELEGKVEPSQITLEPTLSVRSKINAQENQSPSIYRSEEKATPPVYEKAHDRQILDPMSGELGVRYTPVIEEKIGGSDNLPFVHYVDNKKTKNMEEPVVMEDTAPQEILYQLDNNGYQEEQLVHYDNPYTEINLDSGTPYYAKEKPIYSKHLNQSYEYEIFLGLFKEHNRAIKRLERVKKYEKNAFIEDYKGLYLIKLCYNSSRYKAMKRFKKIKRIIPDAYYKKN